MAIDAKKATISALNSGVNDRRGLGLMAMDTMMNILPGPKTLIWDVLQNGSSAESFTPNRGAVASSFRDDAPTVANHDGG
jgi:hypothetical protein